MGNTNVFPLDIEAVKQYGIVQWQRTLFLPVYDDEYVSVSNDIEAAWRTCIEQEPKNVSSILFHSRGLPIEIQHFLHAIWVLKRIEERGLDPVCSKDTPWFSLLLSKHEDGDVYGKRFLQRYSNRERAFRKAVTGVKKRIRELQNNSIRKLISAFRGKGEVCTFGAPYGIIADYIRRSPSWVTITYPSDWTSDATNITIGPSLEAQLHDICTGLFEVMCSIAEKYVIPLAPAARQHLSTTIKRYVLDSAQMLACVQGKGRVNTIEHFIAPNLRCPIQLAIALTVRARGGKVTSFTHGGNVGLFRSPTMAMSEFAVSDEFVMFASGSRPLFEHIYECKKPPFENRLAFVGAATNPFLDLKKSIGERTSPQKIKTIMVVGFPYAPWRKAHPGCGMFWPIRLDFELRLVEVLIRLGYEVLYKVHPDREKEIEGIFHAPVTIVKGHVQEVFDRADALVFGSARTTAMPYAVCTTKPIAICIVQSERPYIFPTAFERLEKRCDIISTWFDDRNRIQFNEHDLAQMFTDRKKALNAEFANEYLFPKEV